MVEDKTREFQERVEELERFNDVAVGRELRLIELEKKLKTLDPLRMAVQRTCDREASLLQEVEVP